MAGIRLPQNEYTVVDEVLSFVQTKDGKSAKIPLINVAGFNENEEVRAKVAAALNKCYSSGEGFAMLEGSCIDIPKIFQNGILVTILMEFA